MSFSKLSVDDINIFHPFPAKKGTRSPTRRPIYAVKADGGVTVKYVEFEEKNGLLILTPENTEHSSEVIRMDKGKGGST